MLKKIISIKNIGKFRSSSFGGDTTLAKISFISGANGFGKTTICSILRSLQTGESSYITGRRTLGATEPCHVQLLFESGTITFSSGAWSAAFPDLAIFDGTFIGQNVHSGDVVDIDQKRNLYRVIVGASGVKLAEQEAKLAADGRAKSTEITGITKAIQTHLPTGMSLDRFLALESIADVETQIAAQEAKLKTLREAETIKTRPPLIPLHLPALPDCFKGVLSKTIDGIAADADLRVKAHFRQRNMKVAEGVVWALQGMEHAEGSCPFCGQSLDGVTLIDAYKAVLSDSYKSLRHEIAALKQQISDSFGETAIAKLETFAAENARGVEFWSKHCKLDPTALEFPSSVASVFQALKGAALTLIEKKTREPLEAVSVDSEFAQAIASFEALKAKIDAFNDAVSRSNALIDSQKTQAGRSESLAVLTTMIDRLKAAQLRHSPRVKKLCDDHARLTREKFETETKKVGVRKSLDEYTNRVVKPYEKRINELLDAFNAGFRIGETSGSYTGGQATSSYQLVINQVAVEIGGINTPNGTPSFKNTLSAGDRSTLALAFLLAHLESDAALASKIVVFDDPFNSQDAYRRKQTIHEILKLSSRCRQTIVFSHDPAFLKQTWLKCDPAQRASIAIIDHGIHGSKIGPHDLEKACQGRTATDTDDLQAYVTNGSGQHVDIIRKMRTVLETYLRSTYPNCFNDGEWLGEMIGKIRDGGRDHPAHDLCDPLNEINDYTSEYHHGENVSDSSSDRIDATELKGFARRTLRIVNALQA